MKLSILVNLNSISFLVVKSFDYVYPHLEDKYLILYIGDSRNSKMDINKLQDLIYHKRKYLRHIYYCHLNDE